MPLDIPDRDAGALVKIAAIPANSMEKFIGALAAAPPNSNPRKMAQLIAPKVPSIPVEQLDRVLETLYTVYHIRELSGVSHSRFLDDLLDSLQRHTGLRLQKKDLGKLRSVLERVLNIDPLQTIAKAARLQRDGERLYCAGKIMSDIRPVFSSDPNAIPAGAVLTHTLKIGFHLGSHHREFHVVLDSSDLAELDEVIQRAKAKDRTLRELLDKTDLSNFGE